MKKIKIYSLVALLFAGFTFVSCDDSTDELTGGAALGGELIVKKGLIGYVVGNGLTTSYDNELSVFQGNEKVLTVDVYKTFTTKDSNGDDVTSNKLLLKTLTTPASAQHEVISIGVSYNELVSGLTIGGLPLPASDSALNIGDYWTLTYVSNLNNGSVHQNINSTKIAVGTRFAGVYKVIQGEYWRINAPRPDVAWVGQIVTIESVTSTAYKQLDYVGPFYAKGLNSHYFTIDASDVVRTPVMYNGVAQVLQTFGAINCEETPALITNACGFAGPQNTVVRDNVTGKDRIYRTYGYNTTSGAVGPREIYEVLEKIVD
jgi:hypothetical protein